MKRKILALVGTLALVSVLVVPMAALADEEGGVGGTFSNNNAPSITSVQLWNVSGPAEVTAMTPQVEFDVRVKVTDVDGLTDFTTIVVKIYKDTDASADVTEFNAESADTKNCAIITWTQSGDLFSIDPSASTTWGFTEGDCVTGTADSVTAFQFKFTVGKVATEAAGAEADCWRAAALVTDDSADTDFDFDVSDNSMAWYGFINTNSGTVTWGSGDPILPGVDFEGTGSAATVSQTINYISNGYYDQQIKSAAATWSGAPSGTATLDDDAACSVADHFGLKADDDDNYADAVLVKYNATYNAIATDGEQTVEDGADEATNTIWIKLASTFAKATYTGTITYIIVNGSA